MRSDWTVIMLDPNQPIVQRPPLFERFPHILEAREPVSRLGDLRVALIGAGAVGRAIAHTLAMWGIRKLLVVDRGQYKPASLLVQGIGPEVIGQDKARVVGHECKQISPSTHVLAFPGAVESLGDADLAEFDAVIMALDSPAAELEVARHCMRLGLPLFQGAVAGEFLLAQVRAWGHHSSEGPCVECHFTAQERQMAEEERIFSCEGAGSAGAAIPQRSGRPTMSPAGLSQLAGHLTAMQFLRHVLRIGEPVIDTELTYCAISHRTIIAPLKRRANCSGEHRRWTRVMLDAPLDSLTLSKLRRLAEIGEGPVSLQIGAHIFSAGRFCDPRINPPADPLLARRTVGDSMLDQHVTFADLGARAAQWAVIESANQAFFFTFGDSKVNS